MFESSLYHSYFYHVQLIEHESYARFKIVCKVQTWGAFQILRAITANMQKPPSALHFYFPRPHEASDAGSRVNSNWVNGLRIILSIVTLSLAFCIYVWKY